MIKQQKSDYTSPTTSILELRSEGLICQSGDPTLNMNDMTRSGYGDPFEI